MFDDKTWTFANMNSPADLAADWTSQGAVVLEEYNRYRDGHALLSEFFVDSGNCRIQVKLSISGNGAAFGLYFGDGCWSRYLGVYIFDDRIEIRIPSRVPLGDTFRSDGAKRYFVLAKREIKLPKELVFEMEICDSILSVYWQSEFLLDCNISSVDFRTDHSRVFLKAVNETETLNKVSATFSDLSIKGESKVSRLNGRIFNRNNMMQPLSDISVHLAGFKTFWTKTDQDGRFIFEGLPLGEYILIVGQALGNFNSLLIQHQGQEVLLEIDPNTEQPRPEYPGIRLERQAPWMNLNGLWSFAFEQIEMKLDREPPDDKDFDRVIKVPYSWSSLAGFGEEYLAKDAELQQFNPIYSNGTTAGKVGWYRRELEIPEDYSDSRRTMLHIEAVSGLAQVWLDGRFMGERVDQYSRVSWNLGCLAAGSRHCLDIRIDADFTRYPLCTGKQGFWFSANPGIWQSVWLENCPDIVITEHLADVRFIDDSLHNAEIDLTVQAEYLSIPENNILAVNNLTLMPNQIAECDISVPKDGLYKFEMNYSAGQGLAAVQINAADQQVRTVFQGTPNANITDIQSVYLNLKTGNNSIRFELDPDDRSFGQTNCEIHSVYVSSIGIPGSVSVSLFDDHDECVIQDHGDLRILEDGSLGCCFQLDINNPILWDMANPRMYMVKATLSQSNQASDETSSLLGLRSVRTATVTDEGHSFILLNNQPVFIRGILDQGYNPWGGYTYVAGRDKHRGSVVFDVAAAQTCGYNLIRMHVKDNDPLWYRSCDELGMLVWDELPPDFNRKAEDAAWRGMFFRQLNAMSRKHASHPSVIIFSPFNESWGISGDHERSPWDDISGQALIRCAAQTYKKSRPGVLLVDNSGYGKTSETDIADYHAYPAGYSQSATFWRRLVNMNYPGSTFNFYNRRNRQLMSHPEIRDLLQRNCQQKLNEVDFQGDDYAAHQPVLISELVHGDRNIKLMRRVPGIAGYVRMNLCSQQNEDASPLTALRRWRDFGWMLPDLSAAGMVWENQVNSLMIDSPELRQVSSGQAVELDLYGSIWDMDNKLDTSRPGQIKWTVAGIDCYGRIQTKMISGFVDCEIQAYKPTLLSQICLTIPTDIRGLIFFAQMICPGHLSAYDSVQMEVFSPFSSQGLSRVDLTSPTEVRTTGNYQIASFDNADPDPDLHRRLF